MPVLKPGDIVVMDNLGSHKSATILKALEEENAKLKKLLAEQMLDAAALRELLAKNVWSASSVQGV
ncbi:hypothetical protein [Brucella intermedia]|uniref:hypothetical protein n=1 Tax=Brucella intermedia TaxID=94625 RepID=UPI003F73E322